jgi:hypothetical protein
LASFIVSKLVEKFHTNIGVKVLSSILQQKIQRLYYFLTYGIVKVIIHVLKSQRIEVHFSLTVHTIDSVANVQALKSFNTFLLASFYEIEVYANANKIVNWSSHTNHVRTKVYIIAWRPDASFLYMHFHISMNRGEKELSH